MDKKPEDMRACGPRICILVQAMIRIPDCFSFDGVIMDKESRCDFVW